MQCLNLIIHLKTLGNSVAYNKSWGGAGRALKSLRGE